MINELRVVVLCFTHLDRVVFGHHTGNCPGIQCFNGDEIKTQFETAIQPPGWTSCKQKIKNSQVIQTYSVCVI